MRYISFAFVVAACVSAGCAGGETATFEGVVADHRDESTVEYRDCGTASQGNVCEETVSAPMMCFTDAYAACEPAELHLDETGIDAAFVKVLFVEPSGDGCRVTAFTDHSADGFKGDYGDFIEDDCAGAALEEFPEEEATCVRLSIQGCEARQEWYE
ncbi:MAG: hypothetical protein ACRBN8_14730 [Nannocystales bacterium]